MLRTASTTGKQPLKQMPLSTVTCKPSFLYNISDDQERIHLLPDIAHHINRFHKTPFALSCELHLDFPALPGKQGRLLPRRLRASAGRLHILNQQRHVTRIRIFENEGDGRPQGNLSQSQCVLFKPDGRAFSRLAGHGTGTPAQKINRPRRNQQSHYQTVF